jgi:hypothetical protein
MLIYKSLLFNGTRSCTTRYIGPRPPTPNSALTPITLYLLARTTYMCGSCNADVARFVTFLQCDAACQKWITANTKGLRKEEGKKGSKKERKVVSEKKKERKVRRKKGTSYLFCCVDDVGNSARALCDFIMETLPLSKSQELEEAEEPLICLFAPASSCGSVKVEGGRPVSDAAVSVDHRPAEPVGAGNPGVGAQRMLPPRRPRPPARLVHAGFRRK